MANARKTRGKINKDVMALRRAKVSVLRLRGLDLREIQKALADSGDLNPDTLEPYSWATIRSDVRFLERRWLAESKKTHGQFLAQMMAEINNLKKTAWSKANHALVLKCLERECKLIGLDSPVRHEISGKDGNPLEIMQRIGGLTPEQQEQRIKELQAKMV